jgi:P-type Cu+ transporter
MDTGTDVAILASDLTLVRGDLGAAPDAIRLSRRGPRHDQDQPVLGVCLQRRRHPIGRRGFLNPIIAGAGKALSRVFVAGNSLCLRRFPARLARP